MIGTWTAQGWGPPEGFEPSESEQGWWHRVGDGADDSNPENWWQPPAGPEDPEFLPDAGNPGWYLRANSDGNNMANWWHDSTVQDEPPAMELWFSPEQIHTVSYGAPLSNIAAQWPLVNRYFVEAGASGVYTAIAALATIRVECPPFWPIDEYGGPSYWARYDWRADLGNVNAGDGARYHGRGLLQLTGRDNYRSYGTKLGIDLEGNPDLALDPDVGARCFVRYFTDRNLTVAADNQNWDRVRTGVNGGYNGWETFLGAVNAYKAMAGA